MRKLDFTDEGAEERFNILYDGLMASSRGYQAPGETRVIGVVLDKMEKLGVPTKDGERATFRWNKGTDPTTRTVLMEDAEHKLMEESLDSVKWNTVGARKATTAIQWFKDAPTVQVEPKKEEPKA